MMEDATNKSMKMMCMLVMVVIIFWALAWSGSSGSFQGSSSTGDEVKHLPVQVITEDVTVPEPGLFKGIKIFKGLGAGQY